MASRYGIDTALGPAGSVVFFDSNILHGSNSNITPSARSNLFYVYNQVDNALQAPFCSHTNSVRCGMTLHCLSKLKRVRVMRHSVRRPRRGVESTCAPAAENTGWAAWSSGKVAR